MPYRLAIAPIKRKKVVMELEPMISRTTIWRANQLHHTHHIYYLSNYLCPTKYRFIQFSVVLTSLGGFEPSTYGLEGRCSIQLSYRLILISPFQKALRISTEKRVRCDELNSITSFGNGWLDSPIEL